MIIFMSMDAEQVRSWFAGFEAAARRDRKALREKGPRSAWAISVSLSMIETAGRPVLCDRRQEEDARVRRIWSRLRQALGSAR